MTFQPNVEEAITKATFEIRRMPVNVGEFLWAYASVESEEHAALHWDDIHFRMTEFKALKCPTDSVLCLMGETDFKKGGLWATTQDKDLVTCKSCIEYIHS